ncbi:MAG: hypothetical protein U1D06_15710, partial [Paracoccaceae bacterium]|nr:hypothetical protein [Paracoccaceae bacterium]
MDRVTNLAAFHPHMPRLSPLSRPVQNLAQPFHDSAAAFEPRMYAWRWRFATFAPALVTTCGVGFVLLDWFRSGGVGWVEVLLVGLICLMFFWIAFSVSTATAGIVASKLPAPRAARPGPASR